MPHKFLYSRSDTYIEDGRMQKHVGCALGLLGRYTGAAEKPVPAVLRLEVLRACGLHDAVRSADAWLGGALGLFPIPASFAQLQNAPCCPLQTSVSPSNIRCWSPNRVHRPHLQSLHKGLGYLGHMACRRIGASQGEAAGAPRARAPEPAGGAARRAAVRACPAAARLLPGLRGATRRRPGARLSGCPRPGRAGEHSF